jgi:hypothetical protein
MWMGRVGAGQTPRRDVESGVGAAVGGSGGRWMTARNGELSPRWTPVFHGLHPIRPPAPRRPSTELSPDVGEEWSGGDAARPETGPDSHARQPTAASSGTRVRGLVTAGSHSELTSVYGEQSVRTLADIGPPKRWSQCRARCLIRAVSSWTCSKVLRRWAISLRIFLSACMTVVWSRPPKVWPMRGSERSVSSRHRYMAI